MARSDRFQFGPSFLLFSRKDSQRVTKKHQLKLQIESLEQRQMLAADCFINDTAEALAMEPAVALAASSTVIEQDASAGVEHLAISTTQGLPESFSTTVTYAGETYTLQLDKNSVFNENTRFLIDDGTGKLVEIDRGLDRSYLGSVAEDNTYSVSAVLSESGLIATIIRPGEGSIKIEPASYSAGPQANGEFLHKVYVEEVVATTDHDHDGDGVPDHSAEDHSNDTDGGHPPGCNCAGCCSNSAEPAAAVASAAATSAATPTSTLAASEITTAANPTLSAVATLAPSRVITVREFEVGVEIGSRAFLASSAYNGNLSFAQSVAQGIAGNMDARYLHGAGIKHRIGTVIIRTNAATDPLRDTVTGTGTSSTANSSLSNFRNYWNSNPGEVGSTHDLAVYHVLSAPSGLAYVDSVGTSNRYATSGGNGPTSWADGTLVHEFGHSWSLAHVSSGQFYESKPRSNGNSAGGSDVFVSVMDGRGEHNIGRLATSEAQQVLGVVANKTQFGDVVPANQVGEVKPFGHYDQAVSAGEAITLDVVANDYDANNDVLDLQIRDTVSQQGGTITLSAGTGPGGRDELIYTPPSGFSGTDFFHYNVIDDTGRSDWGAVYVDVENPTIIVNLSADEYIYDAGPVGSEIFSNITYTATLLSPSTTGDVTWSVPVTATDNGPINGVNHFNRDFIEGTAPATLSHKMENGVWRVTLNMSDPIGSLDNMYVEAEGVPEFTNIDRPNGLNTTMTFNVTVTDGELNLTFGDADVVNPRWAVNRVVLTQLEAFVEPLLPGDFNNDEVVDAADFTVWRKAEGQTVASPFSGADASGNGIVDEADYRIWRSNYGQTVVSTALIDATTGNGEFAIDSAVGVQAIDGAPTATIALNRDRAFVQTSGIGQGIEFPGWKLNRVSYPGGNNAFGVDGNFGLAPNAGEGPGQTGQAFVNSGAADLVSDTINHNFAAGDVIDLSYLLGSDSGGATASVNATVSLIFDEGLPTAFTLPFSQQSAAGLSAPAITEQVRLSQAASSVSVKFELNGVESGERTLVDSVQLSVKTASSSAAAAASETAALSSGSGDTSASVAPVVASATELVSIRLPQAAAIVAARTGIDVQRVSPLQSSQAGVGLATSSLVAAASDDQSGQIRSQALLQVLEVENPADENSEEALELAQSSNEEESTIDTLFEDDSLDLSVF